MKATKTLYALVFKESGEILTPDSFKQHWPNYGGNWLQGWRPPKKVYYKIGHAKTGFSHIPDAIKPSIAIAEFSVSKIVQDGEELLAKQKKAAAIKEIKSSISILKYQIENLRLEQERAKDNNNKIAELEQKLKELENLEA